jgi:hypothetical protein
MLSHIYVVSYVKKKKIGTNARKESYPSSLMVGQAGTVSRCRGADIASWRIMVVDFYVEMWD